MCPCLKALVWPCYWFFSSPTARIIRAKAKRVFQINTTCSAMLRLLPQWRTFSWTACCCVTVRSCIAMRAYTVTQSQPARKRLCEHVPDECKHRAKYTDWHSGYEPKLAVSHGYQHTIFDKWIVLNHAVLVCSYVVVFFFVALKPIGTCACAGEVFSGNNFLNVIFLVLMVPWRCIF